jgi:hypothetical protein
MAKGRKIPTISLVLEEREAEWLRDVMQNPVHGQTQEYEPLEDYVIRYSLYALLTNLLKK